MANATKLRGRKPLVAAQIVRVMRRYLHRSEPVTTTVLRKELPGVPRLSLLHAISALQKRAGLQHRYLPDSGLREFCLGSRAGIAWGLSVTPEQVRHSTTVENTMLLMLADHEQEAR